MNRDKCINIVFYTSVLFFLGLLVMQCSEIVRYAEKTASCVCYKEGY